MSYYYKDEIKAITQKKYGGYCNMCRGLNVEPVQYHSFTGDEYNRIKQIHKMKKKDDKM